MWTVGGAGANIPSYTSASTNSTEVAVTPSVAFASFLSTCPLGIIQHSYPLMRPLSVGPKCRVRICVSRGDETVNDVGVLLANASIKAPPVPSGEHADGPHRTSNRPGEHAADSVIRAQPGTDPSTREAEPNDGHRPQRLSLPTRRRWLSRQLDQPPCRSATASRP